MNPRPSRAASLQGFTLVELLAVLAIMGAVTALCVPSISYFKRSLELQSGLSELAAQLETGRQTARTLNRKVEVRFYLDEERNVPVCRSLRLFLLSMDGTTARPLRQAYYLPGTVNISRSSTFSSLLSLCGTGTDDKGNFCALYFLPDGTVDLAGTNLPTLTLLPDMSSREPDVLPANFATLQIDPRTGRTFSFRP